MNSFRPKRLIRICCDCGTVLEFGIGCVGRTMKCPKCGECWEITEQDFLDVGPSGFAKVEPSPKSAWSKGHKKLVIGGVVVLLCVIIPVFLNWFFSNVGSSIQLFVGCVVVSVLGAIGWSHGLKNLVIGGVVIVVCGLIAALIYWVVTEADSSTQLYVVLGVFGLIAVIGYVAEEMQKQARLEAAKNAPAIPFANIVNGLVDELNADNEMSLQLCRELEGLRLPTNRTWIMGAAYMNRNSHPLLSFFTFGSVTLGYFLTRKGIKEKQVELSAIRTKWLNLIPAMDQTQFTLFRQTLESRYPELVSCADSLRNVAV